MKKWLKFVLFAVVIVSVDVASKAYVNASIPYLSAGPSQFPYGGIGVLQGLFGGIDFSINHVHNTGAAWGAFGSFQKVLLWLRIGVIVGLIVYYFAINRVKKREVPLLMIIFGALGNVIDYFVYGHVIDFFLFRFWNYFYPLFNVADSLIFCGVIYMLFQSYGDKKKREKVHAD